MKSGIGNEKTLKELAEYLKLLRIWKTWRLKEEIEDE